LEVKRGGFRTRSRGGALRARYPFAGIASTQ
jgi:hypothetical protein